MNISKIEYFTQLHGVGTDGGGTLGIVGVVGGAVGTVGTLGGAVGVPHSPTISIFGFPLVITTLPEQASITLLFPAVLEDD